MKLRSLAKPCETCGSHNICHIMSLGKGAIFASSKRQRINTKSSTEAELVGINDVLPQILWTNYFLVAQGYPVLQPTKI